MLSSHGSKDQIAWSALSDGLSAVHHNRLMVNPWYFETTYAQKCAQHSKTSFTSTNIPFAKVTIVLEIRENKMELKQKGKSQRI